MPHARSSSRGSLSLSPSLLAQVLRLPRRTVVLPAALALCVGLVYLAGASLPSGWVDTSREPDDRPGPTLWTADPLGRERAACDLLWTEEVGKLTEHAHHLPTPQPVTNAQATSGAGETPFGSARGSRLDLAEEMMQRTHGFYVRDYPLHLGWNNIRYIIEASLNHAAILNRTLVVPSTVYARSCDFGPETCAAYAQQVHRGMTFDSAEWDYLPQDKQWCWRIPIELMIDIASLQLHRNLVTNSDFLTLIGLDPAQETARGSFGPLVGFLPPSATYHSIPNAEYDTDVNRVDRMPTSALAMSEEARTTGFGRKVRAAMDGSLVEDWEEVKKRLSWKGEDLELEQKLGAVGVYPLWTWRGVLGMEVIHTTDLPIKQVSLGELMRGMWDDYQGRDELILHLEGETHQYRKPGALRFTTPSARSAYAKLMVYEMSAPHKMIKLAETLAARMHERVEGRMWVAAHMRRGDFVKFGWAMNDDSELHFRRITSTLEKGRALLGEIKASGQFLSYPNPGATVSSEIEKLDLPLATDPFYIATDERNATFVEHMRQNGAVFVQDLLTADDRREFGAWELVYTDVMGLVEQSLLSRSSFIYGHALSSVAQGVVNQRARWGKDPRTALLD